MMKQFIGFLMMLGALVSFAQSRLHADPALLLEKAIYLQEVEGDIEQALILYEQAADECETFGDLHASIHFNWANCLYLSGECTDSDLILMNLRQQYKGTHWEQAINDLLDTHYRLDFRAADWDETTVEFYRLSTITGQELGKYIQFAQRTEINKQAAWKLTTITNPGSYPSPHFSQTLVDIDSLQPILQRSSSPVYGDIQSIYSEGKVLTEVTAQDETNRKETFFTGPIYDNDEIIYLLGLLPYQEGYTRTIQAYIPYNLITLNIRFSYDGLTELTLPEGPVSAKKVNLELMLGQQGINQHLFFSNDEQQKLLGFQANNMACVRLGKMSYPSVAQSAPLDLLPLSFTVPADWLVYKEDLINQNQIASHTMISLEDGSQCQISSWKGEPDTPFSAEQARKYALQQAEKIEGYYWENPDGEERTIDGHTFILFTGSFDAMGSSFREWRIHGWDDAHNYLLEMRCKMNAIEDIEPVWNTLIDSIQILKDHESHD